ncbi:hypothetical protein CI109_106946 [Kwoniella shandongensis]|uniref:Uncharacterized protein n=1 Tax=Kwoniella shandongensis TaxID=1734106 RepID=A0A5M6C7F1_9TREE|nr:uncharacterized protein CI109_000800 [Kwoniella shandongensis]KAA5530620.1 hypothetical protein CI109_000800 [Kwoniella shandongensis]
MTTAAGPSSSRHSHSPHPHAAPLPHAHSQHYRHHPYANHVHAKPSSNNRQRANGELPPSPPRSRRDLSETPSIGLGVAFGGNGGGKWWDEELPAPPASLSSILDSFRKSGEGDRDLLLSILGAKKAEEERLTAIIHTRLTILQARLSLHSAAAAAASTLPIAIPSSSHEVGMHMPPPAPAVERTPSLTSSRGPGSASDGINSPPLPAASGPSPAMGYMQPPPAPSSNASVSPIPPTTSLMEKERDVSSSQPRSYWQLPSLNSSLRAPSPGSIRGTSRSPGEHQHALPPIRIQQEEKRGCCPRKSIPKSNGTDRGSLSPTTSNDERRQRSGSGLEMLLDVGMRGLAREKESAERDV